MFSFARTAAECTRRSRSARALPRMELGRVGIWTFALDRQPIARRPEIAAELEELGYGAVWLPEVAGRDPFVHAGLLSRRTERLTVATGIATIYGRDPLTMSSGWKTLTEAFPDRFLLGLGVSHHPRSRACAARRTASRSPRCASTSTAWTPRLLSRAAARRPGAATRARRARTEDARARGDRADGAHPYFVTGRAHRARPRDPRGRTSWLMPEQMVVLETDADEARRIGRGAPGDLPRAAELHEQPAPARVRRRRLRRRRERSARRRDRRVG